MADDTQPVVRAAEMERGVSAATALLKALANPQRLRIPCQLAPGATTVSQLTACGRRRYRSSCSGCGRKTW